MALIMNRANFKRQLQLGLNSVFGMEYDQYPEQFRAMFEVSNSQKAYEEDQLMYGLGGGQVKSEGAAGVYDGGGEAWTARYVNETIVLMFAITEEAVEDGLYGNLGSKYAKSMARGMRHTKDIKGANIFNNGFSSSFPIGDGLALFSTAHPLAGGGTASNTFTTQADLSEASLEDALVQISQLVDDRGIPCAITAQALITPPSGIFNADRILNSALRSGTADNDINAIKHKGMIPRGASVNQRFTDSNSWMLVTDCPDGAKHFVRKAMTNGMEGDFETGNMRYRARERYSFGITNWRAWFGSSGGS